VPAGATDADFAAVEQALGVRLTAHHRALLTAENGWERWYGECFLMMFSTSGVIESTRLVERHPGFLAVASDGSREIIGLDMRRDTPPVVMIDITSSGWGDALLQAESLLEFMALRERHEDLRFDVPYTGSA
jgi:hypothetical protein